MCKPASCLHHLLPPLATLHQFLGYVPPHHFHGLSETGRPIGWIRGFSGLVGDDSQSVVDAVMSIPLYFVL